MLYVDTSRIESLWSGFRYIPTITKMRGEAYLFGDITEEMAGEFVRKLNEHKPDELTIYLSTNGGILSAGLAMYDAIQRVSKVTVIATGLCASTGTLILLAGTFRVATPNTHFLVHDVELEPTSLAMTIDAAANGTVDCDLSYLNAAIDKIFAKRIGESKYQQAKDIRNFNSQKALSLNFIDRIGDR